MFVKTSVIIQKSEAFWQSWAQNQKHAYCQAGFQADKEFALV